MKYFVIIAFWIGSILGSIGVVGTFAAGNWSAFSVCTLIWGVNIYLTITEFRRILGQEFISGHLNGIASERQGQED